ncbi:fumarylacetoacetate hydrolase family protein [Croceicoccus sp. BE223]|uniref:2-keto-4-pentenoate hydratase n=1 Tax=Croceicoccus sp. BE223 TaxID=2817716 RepID=UPI002857C66A|nr:fumarylacetoacetate hydrolase family protein [Croceicoccus sp. BE223]MDR7102942.1 2-keto-4-pentenoate hydratase [Croceicoccus sp. BE223]
MQIATAFRDARLAGTIVAEYPGERPQDLDAAYLIQDCGLEIAGSPVVGWKVGRINPPHTAILGSDRLAGPVLEGTVRTVEAGGVPVAMPICPGGFAAAEAEFVVRLSADAVAAAPEDDEATLAIIDDIVLGIEIASSPYPGINADGPCVTVSDRGNNGGLVLGASVPRDLWASLNDVEVALTIDGSEVGRATTATMLDGPLGAVRFLLANLRSRGIETPAGLLISTGAITGVHEIASGQVAEGTFAGIGSVRTLVR